MAPECVRNKPVGLEADIWSLGCILYQFITGLCPFRGASDYLIFRRSTEAKVNLLLLPCEQSRDLVSRCLTLDAQARPNIAEVLAHPFLQVAEKPALEDWQRDLKPHLEDFIK